MSGMRKLARTVARNKSYAQNGNTGLFSYFFSKEWREKGHPANLNKTGCPGPTKKNHRPACVKG